MCLVECSSDHMLVVEVWVLLLICKTLPGVGERVKQCAAHGLHAQVRDWGSLGCPHSLLPVRGS